MTPLSIEVVSDCVCPWCYIGSVRLERVLASETAAVQVVYRPFFLNPATPDAGVDIRDMLRRNYGADPQQLWARAEAAARESGLELDLSRQPRQYPTLRAHTLLRHALARGTQRGLARGLFEANFDQARNLNDPSVLASVGATHGFDPDEVIQLVSDASELAVTRQEAADAAAAGVNGVPFFVFDGRLAVAGAQREAVLGQALRQALETRPASEPGGSP